MESCTIESKFKSIECELDIIDGRTRSIINTLNRKIGVQASSIDLKKLFCGIAAVYLLKRVL